MRTCLKDEVKKIVTFSEYVDVISAIKDCLGDIRKENMVRMTKYQVEKGKYFYTDTYKEYEKFDDALFESIVHLEDVENLLGGY